MRSLNTVCERKTSGSPYDQRKGCFYWEQGRSGKGRSAKRGGKDLPHQAARSSLFGVGLSSWVGLRVLCPKKFGLSH